MEQQRNSRLNFLKAGLLVGGAMYADPAAALAQRGGSFFEPDSFLVPGKTPISKFIPGSQLPGNTGEITLADFAAIADLNNTKLLKLSKKFSQVTFGDIGDCISYVIDKQGSSGLLFGQMSGQEGISCCCCCCTTAFFPLNNRF